MCVLTRSMCKSLTWVFRRPPFLFTLLDFKPIIVIQFFSAVQTVSYVNKSTWFHFVCRGIAWTHNSSSIDLSTCICLNYDFINVKIWRKQFQRTKNKTKQKKAWTTKQNPSISIWGLYIGLYRNNYLRNSFYYMNGTQYQCA